MTILRPSNAGHLVQCPASLKMQEPFPDTPTQEILEGDAVHWLAEYILKYHKETKTLFESIPENFNGCQAPNGVEITTEMIQTATVFIKDVMAIINKHGGWSNDVHIESKIENDTVHSKNGGTPDLWVYIHAIKTIFIWDLKNGHRVVPAFKNWQCLNYGWLISEQLGIDGHEEQHVNFHIRIVQPRNYKHAGAVDNWVVRISDTRDYKNQLRAAFTEALLDNPTTKTGPLCRDCKAIAVCHSAQQAAYNAMDVTAQYEDSIANLEVDELAIELNMLELAADKIEYRLAALKVKAEELLRSGIDVPGRIMKERKGKLRWIKPVEDVLALGSLLGLDIKKPVETMTPTQVLSSIPEGYEVMVEPYTERDKPSFRMEKQDDTLARKVFTKVIEENSE